MLSPKRTKYSPKEDSTHGSGDEYLKSLQAIESLQNDMNGMRDKLDREVIRLEQKLEIDKKPLYMKREEVINQIPNFWVTALMNHPDITALLDETEEEYLLYISKIEVQLVEEMENGFKIVFYFKENPYFKNTTLVKEYVSVIMDGKSKNVITATPVIWKEEHDVNQKIKERKSFLSWLICDDFGSRDIDIAQVIKEDLWINPLPYYLLSDAENDNSEEEEESEDEVLIIEDSDDEKSTHAEPENEDSDNESEEYDSPASSEVNQNEN